MKSIVVILMFLVAASHVNSQGLYINIINGKIYEVQSDYSLTLATTVVNYMYSITDIAISPANKMYGVAAYELIEIDFSTGAVTVLKNLPKLGYISLVCDNEYNLYTLAGNGLLFRYNILSDSLQMVADVQDSSPGDLTFYRGNLLFQSSNDGNFKAYNLESGTLSTILCQAAPLVGIGIWGTSTVFTDCETQRVFASDYLDNFYELDIENGVIYLREQYEKFAFPGGLDINGMASSSEHLASACNHVFENIQCATSLEKNEETTSSIAIYPNPATDQVVIESRDPIRSVHIFSMDGSLLKQYSSETQLINVSDFTSGVYILQFRTETYITIKRLVIQ